MSQHADANLVAANGGDSDFSNENLKRDAASVAALTSTVVETTYTATQTSTILAKQQTVTETGM